VCASCKLDLQLISNTLIQPGCASLALVSPLMSHLGFCLDLGGELLEQEKDNVHAVKCKGESRVLREHFEEQWAEVM
jgi:hypothetical protein